MSKVTIRVASLEETMHQFVDAAKGTPQGEFITFVSMELLWKTLTPPRWDLLQAMAGKGPMSLRAAARLVNKDVKTVHGDVHALLRGGVLKKNPRGQIVFPYDAIHVDFTIRAAA